MLKMNKHAKNNGKNCQKLTKFDSSCTVAYLRGHGKMPPPDRCKCSSKVHKNAPKYNVFRNKIPKFSGKELSYRLHLLWDTRGILYNNTKSQ